MTAGAAGVIERHRHLGVGLGGEGAGAGAQGRRPSSRRGGPQAVPVRRQLGLGQRHLVLAALLPQLARLAPPLALADGRPAAQVRQREKALVVAAVGRPDNRVQRRMLTNR